MTHCKTTRWTISPMSTEENPFTLKAEEVMEIHHDIKIPHGIQTPYHLHHKDTSGNWIRICRWEYRKMLLLSYYHHRKLFEQMNIYRIRLAHVGKNFPCLKDPTYGYKSQQNSSAINYYSRDRTWGKGAKIDFDMISNWGKKN